MKMIINTPFWPALYTMVNRSVYQTTTVYREAPDIEDWMVSARIQRNHNHSVFFVFCLLFSFLLSFLFIISQYLSNLIKIIVSEWIQLILQTNWIKFKGWLWKLRHAVMLVKTRWMSFSLNIWRSIMLIWKV